MTKEIYNNVVLFKVKWITFKWWFLHKKHFFFQKLATLISQYSRIRILTFKSMFQHLFSQVSINLFLAMKVSIIRLEKAEMEISRKLRKKEAFFYSKECFSKRCLRNGKGILWSFTLRFVNTDTVEVRTNFISKCKEPSYAIGEEKLKKKTKSKNQKLKMVQTAFKKNCVTLYFFRVLMKIATFLFTRTDVFCTLDE